MVEPEGQICETTPTGPGVLSYFNITRDPHAMAAIHPAPNKAVTRIFLRLDCTEVEPDRSSFLSSPYSSARGILAFRAPLNSRL